MGTTVFVIETSQQYMLNSKKQWKKVKTRYKNLRKLGLNQYLSLKFANTRKGYWRIADSFILNRAIPNIPLIFIQ